MTQDDLKLGYRWGGSEWGWYMWENYPDEDMLYMFMKGDENVKPETREFIDALKRERAKSLYRIGKLIEGVLQLDKKWQKEVTLDKEKVSQLLQAAEQEADKISGEAKQMLRDFKEWAKKFGFGGD